MNERELFERDFAPGQEPVAEVEQCDVHPSQDGLYRSVVKSKERLSVQAELFVHPPTSATVEAATIERCKQAVASQPAQQAEAQAGETPRTDPYYGTWATEWHNGVSIFEHACQLERELRAANERAESERRMADHARGRVMELAKEIDALRAQLAAQRDAALEEAAVICDEMREHWSAYKDTALLNGNVELSNAASGEPRAAEFLAKAIRALRNKADAQEVE